MSVYTIELRHLIQNDIPFDLGLKDYPIFDESHRQELNDKIINHYWNYEIGLETPQLFKIKLNQRMKEIMPYFNQLYKSESIEFNPLYNIEIHETYEHEVTGIGKTNAEQEDTSTSNSKGSNNNTTTNTGENQSTKVHNEMPQNDLSYEDVRTNKFATDTDNILNNESSTNTNTGTTKDETEINSNGSSTVNSENKQNETYKKTTEGSSAGLPFSKAIKQWREIMLNIDMQIIDKLSDLFIQIW